MRLALKFKWTIFGAAFCSLMVAVLWGANIAAVYPFVEVVFQGESLQAWMEKRIEIAENKCAELRSDIAGLELKQGRAVNSKDKAKYGQQIAYLQYRLSGEESAIATGLWLLPYAKRYLPDDAFQTLLYLVGFLLVATIIKDSFLVGGMMLMARLGERVSVEMRRIFFRKVLKFEIRAFDKSHTGEWMSRSTGDIGAVSSGVVTLFGQGVREPLKMIACLIGAAMISWQLLVLSFMLMPLASVTVLRLNKLLKKANKRILEENSQYYRRLMESFSLITVVKAYTMERLERGRLFRASKDIFARCMHARWYDAFAKFSSETLGIAVLCLAIVVGGYLVLNQETHLFGIPMTSRPLTVGGLLLFFGFLAGASDPARKLTDLMTSLQRAAAAADRVYAILDKEPNIIDGAGSRQAPAKPSEIHFDRIDFNYLPNQPVLQDMSLRINDGETLAIVGPNGCGKSTLTNLLLRFYDPAQGAVRIDGIDIREFRVRDLRRMMAIVTQQPLLFDDTIFNNIRYGTWTATEDEIIAAAQKAHAHQFVEQLDKGYQTVVGERGGRLSGGQRQRIVLARAILRDPAILVLDEATSQIDAESEQLIHLTLKQFVRDRITILITHRLSSLTLADRIAVMDAGQLVELGSHEELLGRSEFYRRLCENDLRKTA